MKVNEIKKQWGIAEYEYGVANLDLSRCCDDILCIKRMTWGELQKDLVADEIRKNGADGIEGGDSVDIYKATDGAEEYNIYVPSWWD